MKMRVLLTKTMDSELWPPRRVTSFDVFDTLLARRVGSPKSAFLLLGHRLRDLEVISCTAESFSRQRHAAEARSFANAGGLDSPTSLRTIYDELAMSIGLTPDEITAAIKIEIELEHDLLVSVPAGVAKLKAARRRGDRIVFVSDMYLPSSEIRSLLAEHDLFLNGDELFVSNEVQASKATGALWPVVLDHLDVRADRVTHIGNDKRSDHRKARSAGMRTRPFPEGNLNRFEEVLESHAAETDGIASLLAGASRLARLSTPKTNCALRDVAAGVVAPFVVGYVLWVLRRAIDDGVEKVYFVARDGQLLLDVARVLAPKVGYGGEMHYLYGSRQAWMLPSLVEVTPESVESIAPDKGDVDVVTVRTIMHRLGIEPEEARAVLTSNGFDASGWDTPMAATDCQRLRAAVLANGDLHTELVEIAAVRRADMVQYLDRCGVITDKRIALVDLGTGATLHNYLAKVLSTVGQEPPTSYYFGLRREAIDVGFGLPATYVRDEQSGTGLLSTPGWLTLVEMACTADHGSVLGYERSGDGIVEPSLAAESNELVTEWGLQAVQEVVIAVASHLRFDRNIDPLRVDLRPAAFAAFQEFWERPTAAEARRWASYPFEDGWSGDPVHLTLAAPQGIGTALRSQPHRHWWKAGARAMSRPVPRAMMRARHEALGLYRKLR